MGTTSTSCGFYILPTLQGTILIQSVSGGLVNILGSGSTDLLTYSMEQSPS